MEIFSYIYIQKLINVKIKNYIMKLKKKSSSKSFHTHTFTGYCERLPYFTYSGSGVIDGVGRQHLEVFASCDTCFERIKIGMIHVDKNGVIYKK